MLEPKVPVHPAPQSNLCDIRPWLAGGRRGLNLYLYIYLRLSRLSELSTIAGSTWPFPT
jgi:hypothetical protein